MDERLGGALQVLGAIAIAAAVLLLGTQIEALAGYGYAGAFLIALLSSATMFLPAPGWVILLAMMPFMQPLPFALAAGIGSGLGELTGYFAGGGARHAIGSRVKEYKRFEALVERYDVPAVFILALVPNQLFDLAGIAAGAIRMPVWKFLLACIAGKVLRFLLLAYAGAYALGLLQAA